MPHGASASWGQEATAFPKAAVFLGIRKVMRYVSEEKPFSLEFDSQVRTLCLHPPR